MNYVDELNMLEFAIILINIDRANEKLNIDKRKWQATINKYYIFNFFITYIISTLYY